MQALAEFLPDQDVAKVDDFIRNRRRPPISDADFEKFPPEERKQIRFEIELTLQDFLRRRAKRQNRRRDSE